ncbi:DUF3040 domain-containing protein [Actinocorallia longicatena]|uniref:DUF3040 domain-containing protein n=1 Tax=Actinocorallia longicatena TaxID=111803 RepID=A0ABP6PUQ3_9ACTN
MALSMDEERILTEIASRLSHDDPRLAERLERFGKSRRSRRERIVVAVIVAVVGLVAAFGTAVAIFFSQ